MEGIFRSNGRGGYFALANKDYTCYQGLFFFLEKEWDLYKTIHDLVLKNVDSDFEFSDGRFLRRSSNGVEDFFIFDWSLLYISNFNAFLSLDLDFRRIHDFDDKGRVYDSWFEDDLVVVHYKKFSDDSISFCKDDFFMVVKGANNVGFEKNWSKKFFVYDAERNVDAEKYVYRLMSFDASRLGFGFGNSLEDAKLRCELAFNANITKDNYSKINGVVDDFSLAKNSFNDLFVRLNNKGAFLSEKFNESEVQGLFAGFPWFYQFWSRDENIALAGFFIQEKYAEAKNILMRNLSMVLDNGVLPNRWPDSVLGSADGTGWFHKRLLDLLLLKPELFSDDELLLLEQKVSCYIDYMKENVLGNKFNLVWNNSLETWMDTSDSSNVDTRQGFRIEIQALFLVSLNLDIFLKKNLNKMYDDSLFLKGLVLGSVRNALVFEGILLDGAFLENGLFKHDLTFRPNVFLAKYIYPDLVDNGTWIKTFDAVIEHCWLDWGGFSSISKYHYLFVDNYTGMNNISYHRGDSWFFVNNLAGLVLNNLDDKYSVFVRKILEASLFDLKNLGFKGCCSEISSASSLSAKGSLAQVWSSSTLLELLKKLNLKV